MVRCFNSRTPGGVRPRKGSFLICVSSFQFTHPGRGATYWRVMLSYLIVFQFTHPGRGATLLASHAFVPHSVSIHAPREGCDYLKDVLREANRRVSIHAPREGCDGYLLHRGICTLWFQFTHPGRGATQGSILLFSGYSVSIHAPREGCDLPCARHHHGKTSFNSRTPGGVRQSDTIGRSF